MLGFRNADFSSHLGVYEMRIFVFYPAGFFRATVGDWKASISGRCCATADAQHRFVNVAEKGLNTHFRLVV